MAFGISRLQSIFSQPDDFDSVDPMAGNRKRFLSGVSPFAQPAFKTLDPQVDPGEDEGSKYWNELERIRSMPSPALSAYQGALKDQPTREAYKPSIGRRMLAALEGFAGGPQAAIQTNELPYQRAQSSYAQRLGGLKESAGLEEKQTENLLKDLTSARALGLKYDEYKLNQLKADRENNINQGRLRVEEGNLDVNRGRLQNEKVGTEGLNTYRQGELGIGRRNASVNERNAGTNAKRATDTKAYQDAMVEVRKNANGKKMLPTQQRAAIDIALKDLRSNKSFRDFIPIDDSGAVMIGEDDGSPNYKLFKQQLAAKVKSIIENASPFDDGSDSEDDSDEDDIIFNGVSR